MSDLPCTHQQGPQPVLDWPYRRLTGNRLSKDRLWIPEPIPAELRTNLDADQNRDAGCSLYAYGTEVLAVANHWFLLFNLFRYVVRFISRCLARRQIDAR